MRWRRPCAFLSLFLVVATVLFVALNGVKLGIEFSGGVETRLRVLGTAPVGEGDIRAALAGLDVESISRLGDIEDRTFVVRTQVEDPNDARALERTIEDLDTALATALGTVRIESTDAVGANVGAEFAQGALLSIALSLITIGGYLALRFSMAYAPGAVLALAHDAVLAAGAVAVCGFPFDFSIVAGLLTVVGYSINDTIVIFDRIRENVAVRTTAALERLIDDSLNETMSRTLLTAGTTLLTSVSLLVFGGDVLRGFALVVTVGVIVGTYSSIFIAAPFLLHRMGGSAPGRPIDSGHTTPTGGPTTVTKEPRVAAAVALPPSAAGSLRATGV